jgi:hypothetical protein
MPSETHYITEIVLPRDIEIPVVSGKRCVLHQVGDNLCPDLKWKFEHDA